MGISWLLAVWYSLSLEESRGASVFLNGNLPDADRAGEILAAEQEREIPTDVCFYLDGGIQKVTRTAFGRSERVMHAVIYGNPSVFDWQAASLQADDSAGCVIDRETAVSLFGTSQAAGEEMELGDRTLRVTAVTDWKNKCLVSLPGEEQVFFTRIFLKVRNGENIVQKAEEFLMQYGLSGTVVQTGGEKSRAFWALAALPALLLLKLSGIARKQQKNYAVSGPEYWVWLMFRWIPLAAALVFLWYTVEIPYDWIPGKWSDFDFWTQKIQKTKETWRLWYLLPKTAVELGDFLTEIRIWIWGILPVPCYFLINRIIRENS